MDSVDDVALVIRRGKKFLDRLNSTSRCFIQPNYNTNTIRLFGSEEDIEIAQNEIRRFVAMAKNDQDTVLTLTGMELHRLIGKQANALTAIEDESGATSVSINWYKSTVTILGSEAARGEASRIISERLATLRSVTNIANDVDNGVPECRLCFSEPEDYTLILCGHKCCRSCLNRMLDMFSRPDIDMHFPIRCPIDHQCGQVVALSDIRACTDIATFESICMQSTKSFIENSTDVRFCFSAQCNSVIPDSPEKRGFIRCASCAAEFCSSCCGKDNVRGVPWHKGLSCAQYQGVLRDGGQDLLNDYLSKSGGRHCPRCRQFVERNGGCDHMTCLCNHNFCYQCGANSSRSSCLRPCPA